MTQVTTEDMPSGAVVQGECSFAASKLFLIVFTKMFGATFVLISAVDTMQVNIAILTMFQYCWAYMLYDHPEPGLQIKEYSFDYCR